MGIDADASGEPSKVSGSILTMMSVRYQPVHSILMQLAMNIQVLPFNLPRHRDLCRHEVLNMSIIDTKKNQFKYQFRLFVSSPPFYSMFKRFEIFRKALQETLHAWQRLNC